MKKNTLLFHIGTQKTGTTSLQKTLYNNRDLLRKYGWEYPDLMTELSGFYDLYEPIEKNGGVFFKKNRKLQTSNRLWDYIWEKLEGYLSKYNVIISDEALWVEGNEDFWKKVKDRYDEVQVVIYLRRQDLFMESIYRQRVRCRGERRTFEQYVSGEPYEFNLDYYSLLNSIATQVGRNNIIVRVYENGQLEGGKTEVDFFKTIGIDIGSREFERQNSSLDRNTIELNRIYNDVSIRDEDDRIRHWKGFQELVRYSAIRDDSSYFERTGRLQFLNKYSPSNSLVAEEFLGRSNGCLFFDNPDDRDRSSVIDGGWSNDELARLVFMMFVETDRELQYINSRYKKIIENIIRDNAKGKRIILFGAGNNTRVYLKDTTLEIECIVDNDSYKIGKEIEGKIIRAMDSIEEANSYYYVVTPNQTESIEKQLNSCCLIKNRDYFLLKEFY